MRLTKEEQERVAKSLPLFVCTKNGMKLSKEKLNKLVNVIATEILGRKVKTSDWSES